MGHAQHGITVGIMLMTSCLAPHPPLPQSASVQLEWLPPRDDRRCRIIAWTCDCRAVHYEFCQSGGLGFVRRVIQGEENVVSETHHVRLTEAHHLWAALLTGPAR